MRWIIGEQNVLNALIKDYLEVVAHLRTSAARPSGRTPQPSPWLCCSSHGLQSIKLIYFLLDVIAVLSRLAYVFRANTSGVPGGRQDRGGHPGDLTAPTPRGNTCREFRRISGRASAGSP